MDKKTLRLAGICCSVVALLMFIIGIVNFLAFDGDAVIWLCIGGIFLSAGTIANSKIGKDQDKE